MYTPFIWAVLALPVLSSVVPIRHSHLHQRDLYVNSLVPRQSNDTDGDAPPLLSNATVSDVEKARNIVKAAIAQAAIRNKARVDNPSRNNYALHPGSKIAARDGEDAVPLLNVTEEMRKAAALVAEADAYAETKNGTLRRHKKRAGTFWLGQMAHVGSWPFGDNPSDFTVFRDVTDAKYGAKGDGVTVGSRFVPPSSFAKH